MNGNPHHRSIVVVHHHAVCAIRGTQTLKYHFIITITIYNVRQAESVSNTKLVVHAVVHVLRGDVRLFFLPTKNCVGTLFYFRGVRHWLQSCQFHTDDDIITWNKTVATGNADRSQSLCRRLCRTGGARP